MAKNTSSNSDISTKSLENQSTLKRNGNIITNAQLDEATNNLQPPEDSEVNNYESEVDLDIPTEENYFKSSTSVSGDEDVLDNSRTSRPRSVHFEDELWDQGQYVSKGLSKSDGTLYMPTSNEDVTYRSRSDSNQSLENSEEFPQNIFSMRPMNVRSARGESVREMLRKRREGVEEILENDGRRRIQTKHISPASSRSVSRVPNVRRAYNNHEDRLNSGLTKSQSMSNVNKKLHELNTPSRSRCPSRSTTFPSGNGQMARTRQSNPGEAAYISRTNYAMLQSLVGTTNSNSSSSSSTRSQKRETQKKTFSRNRKKTSRRSTNDSR